MKRLMIVALFAASTMTPAMAGKTSGSDACPSILFPGCLDIFIGTYSIGWW